MLKTHGHTIGRKISRTYRIWANMMQRCTNPKNPRYADYGGRGIKVTRRWYKFERFLEDMGVPATNETLDRKDNDKGYHKSNCRWADARTQAQNSRRAVNLTIQGKTQCIASWCRENGISYGLYKARVKRGWAKEIAATMRPMRRGLRVFMED